MYYDRYWQDANFSAVARFKEIAGEHGRNMAQFALAWTLSNPAVTSAICGATSLSQLEQNLGATEVELSLAELAACDEVWQQLRPPRFLYGR